MGNAIAPCCEDSSSATLVGTHWGEGTPWAAVVDGVTSAYIDTDGVVQEDAKTLHIRSAPGSSRLPRVPLYEGPDKQTRQLGFLDLCTPARVLEESSDARWVHVQEETDSDRSVGRSGWVNARSVPQQVVNRLCARTDLGRPSLETVHAALSHSGGDLTDAVRELRNAYASQVGGRGSPPPRIPVKEITQAAVDSSLLSSEERTNQRRSPSMLYQAGQPLRALKVETSSARADLI
jgi:hypothetical protein